MSTSSQQFHFFLLCMIISLSITDGTELIIVNNCKDSIWPGILGTAGHVTPREGGFLLLSGEQTVLQVPDKWSGRIWPRQGCCFDETTGRGSCQTGDCAGGGAGCGVAACETNLNVCCPSTLVLKRQGKAICPKAYSFAFDDASGLKTCKASRVGATECTKAVSTERRRM
ncbi:hypothetical protein OIU78_005518 [Salix suchowensis]|nr:hypothetical protein OIU78_005518 [Salix suchowensis]